jgi:hypothetical protein
MCGGREGTVTKSPQGQPVLRSQVVRIPAIVIASVLAVASQAAADPRDDLQAKGEQLAKEGRFGEAIEQWKAADRIEPRASHACLIALAYTRRELWPQAELFLSLCHSRATATDPMPSWVPEAEQQLKERLLSANVTAVTIDVTPASANPSVTVSSFAPDEVFGPRTIHLPPGTHVIFAKAEGYEPKQVTLEIKDKAPKHVVIDLGVPAGAGIAQPPPPVEVVPRPASRVGLYVMIGGGVVAALGVGSHISMSASRKTLVDNDPDHANNQVAYDAEYPAFERARAAAITCYVVGAGLLVTGYLLRSKAKREASVQLTAAPLPEGGGFVSLEWSR